MGTEQPAAPRVTVDPDLCIGTGDCWRLVPDAFQLDEARGVSVPKPGAEHADQLVVGWIGRLELDTGGPGVKSPTEGGDHMLSGSATVLVQIFAAAEGRIVAEAQGDGSMLGQTRLLITRQVLHDAAGEAVTKLVAKMPPAP